MLWTKETALTELRTLIEDIDTLKSCKRYAAEYSRWLIRTRTFLSQVFGENSLIYNSFASIDYTHHGSILVPPVHQRYADRYVEERHQEQYVSDLETGRGFLLAGEDLLVRGDLTSVYEGKSTGPESSELIRVINLAEFKLRKTVRNSPEQEKAIQDAFENLLIAQDGIEFTREMDRISYSTKTYIPDFVIEKLDLAIEIKLCHRPNREKELIAEINDDIAAYKTKYGNLLFVVYDLSFIRDVEKFAAEFERHVGVIVRIVKH